MTRIWLSALFGALLGSCQITAPDAPLTLQTAVANAVEARGGAAALDAVHSQRIDVQIDENGYTLIGHYAATDSGLVRIDIYADGVRVFSEGIDNAGTWKRGGDGPAEASTAPGAREALAHGAEDHLFGWHRFAARGHSLRLVEPQEVEGQRYPVVEVRYNTGHVSWFYLDPDSWLVARKRDERAYHPDLDLTKVSVETRTLEFARTGGVVFPAVSVDTDLGSKTELSRNTVLRRVINPELAADYFDRSREVPGTLGAED